MLIRSISVLLAAASLAAAGHASAQPYDNDRPAYDQGSSVDELVVRGRFAPDAQVRAWRVSFADLDLDSWAGAHTLLGRIHGAAVQVCSPEPSGPTELKDGADYRSCLQDAVARAVNDVDAPSLNRVYGDRDWR